MNSGYHDQSQKVALYYDQWQPGYDQVYGDTIQAFRPQEKEDLMKYISASAGLADGQIILDAGCGIGGPAIWIAKKCAVEIKAVTISPIQADQARKAVADQNLSSGIQVLCADYHELSTRFESNYFDRALFLESLGHSGDPGKAISETFTVLKPGGSIYIKDFYYKEPNDTFWADRIKRTIDNINRLYQYNTLNLTHTISALRAAGFEIDFIRRFAFHDDISIRAEFERRFNIDIFGGEEEFTPAEWLEIKCTKPLS
jgi:cyclopropane fatty-acyl-phospholipid synthase-like methyltransferase